MKPAASADTQSAAAILTSLHQLINAITTGTKHAAIPALRSQLEDVPTSPGILIQSATAILTSLHQLIHAITAGARHAAIPALRSQLEDVPTSPGTLIQSA